MAGLKNTKKHYPIIAELYKAFEHYGFYDSPDGPHAPCWSKLFLEECTRIIRITGNKIWVLDIGTGMSLSLIGFIRKFPKIVQHKAISAFPTILSIDIDKEAIKLSRDLLTTKGISKHNCQHLVADACSLCFRNGEIDLVACILSLHDISKQGFALYEILKVCKFNGFVILIDSSEDFKRQIYQHPKEAIARGIVNFVDASDLQKVLRNILPLSSISVKRFQDYGHRVGRTTRYFLCVIRKTDKEIEKFEETDLIFTEQIDHLTDELEYKITEGVRRLTKEFKDAIKRARARVETD